MTVATDHQFPPSATSSSPRVTHSSLPAFQKPSGSRKTRKIPSVLPNGPYLHTYNAKPPSPPPVFDQDSNETDDDPLEDEENTLFSTQIPKSLLKPQSFLDLSSSGTVYSSAGNPAIGTTNYGPSTHTGKKLTLNEVRDMGPLSVPLRLELGSGSYRPSPNSYNSASFGLEPRTSDVNRSASDCSSANTSAASTSASSVNTSSANTSTNIDSVLSPELTKPKLGNKCECGIHKGPMAAPHTCKTHRVNLDLLLEASEAFAKAERESRNRAYPDCQTQVLLDRATQLAQADRYITAAINRVQSSPQISRTEELRPIDRRDQTMPPNWSRLEAILSDPYMESECLRVVRGMQGCGRDCSAKFTNLVEFAQHMDQNHHLGFRPYCCPAPHCPWGVIGFHERSECTRHIRTKHYKAMFVCEFEGCNKVYNRSDAFRRHIRHSHSAAASQMSYLPEEEGRYYYYSRRY